MKGGPQANPLAAAGLGGEAPYPYGLGELAAGWSDVKAVALRKLLVGRRFAEGAASGGS